MLTSWTLVGELTEDNLMEWLADGGLVALFFLQLQLKKNPQLKKQLWANT